MNNQQLAKAQGLHRAGRLDEAEKAYGELLARSEDPDAQHGLALLYNQTGRSEAAIPILEQLLQKHNDAVSSRLVLARCLAATGSLKAALEQSALACQMLPENAAVWSLNGQLLQQAGDAEAALVSLQKALEIDPTHGPALHNQGIALATQGKLEAAALAYEGALRVMPLAARVHYNYALALQSLGREAAAMAALARALDLRPGMTDARLRLMHLKLLHCQWRELDDETTRIQEGLEKLLEKKRLGHLSLHVLNLLDLPQSLHRDLARRMASEFEQQAADIAAAAGRAAPADGRVRLAYLSPDLGAHAVGGLLQDVFACHDSDRFDVCVFSLRAFDDAVASKIRAGAAGFEDLSAASIGAAAQRIASFGPDILVDLGGYTQGARSELMAMRLAPVQVSWLGYLNTMGADFIDYLVADDIAVPPGADKHYDEKIARMPRCFLPFSHMQESPETITRLDVGLPDNAFVFASFNNTCKVQPAELRAWVRILREAPDAVLWMYDGNREAVRETFTKAFALARLDPARLVFAPMRPMHEHLRRMRLADLMLDTFRYNAGATAIAAAQVGLPVLTMAGNSLLGRMGAAINHALGNDDLVCSDVDDYVARAVAFTRNTSELRRISAAMDQASKERVGFFDTAGFVRDLEDLLLSLKRQ